MKNHEIWNTCEVCGCEYDTRTYTVCPDCLPENIEEDEKE